MGIGDNGAGDWGSILSGQKSTGTWGGSDGYFSFYGKKGSNSTSWGMDRGRYSVAFGRDDKNYGYCFVENNDPTKNIYEDNLKCEDTETYDAWFYIR